MICQKNGHSLNNTKNLVINPQRPNDLWEIDLIGRIPDKKNGINLS